MPPPASKRPSRPSRWIRHTTCGAGAGKRLRYNGTAVPTTLDCINTLTRLTSIGTSLFRTTTVKLVPPLYLNRTHLPPAVRVMSPHQSAQRPRNRHKGRSEPDGGIYAFIWVGGVYYDNGHVPGSQRSGRQTAYNEPIRTINISEKLLRAESNRVQERHRQ